MALAKEQHVDGLELLTEHADLQEVQDMLEDMEGKGGAFTKFAQRLREKLRIPEWLKQENIDAYIRSEFKNDLPIIGDDAQEKKLNDRAQNA